MHNEIQIRIETSRNLHDFIEKSKGALSDYRKYHPKAVSEMEKAWSVITYKKWNNLKRLSDIKLCNILDEDEGTISRMNTFMKTLLYIAYEVDIPRKITPKDVCKVNGISQATFYRAKKSGKKEYSAYLKKTIQSVKG